MSDRIEFPPSIAQFHLEFVAVKRARDSNWPRRVASIGMPHDVAQRLVERRDHGARLGGIEVEFPTATFDHGPRQPQPARIADYPDVDPCDHDRTGNWRGAQQAATRRDCSMPQDGPSPGISGSPGSPFHSLEASPTSQSEHPSLVSGETISTSPPRLLGLLHPAWGRNRTPVDARRGSPRIGPGPAGSVRNSLSTAAATLPAPGVTAMRGRRAFSIRKNPLGATLGMRSKGISWQSNPNPMDTARSRRT